jgi:hypothetical protein
MTRYSTIVPPPPPPKPNLNPVKIGAIISNSYSTLTESTVLGGINLITTRSSIRTTSIMHEE